MPINTLGAVGTNIGIPKTNASETVSGADFKKMLFSELEKVNQAQDDAKAKGSYQE